MNVVRSNAGSTAIISPKGRFEFSGHREFRDVAQAAIADAAIKELQVDLRDTEYLDSSALGLLLLTKEQAAAVGKSVCLSGARGMVAQVLEIANFQKLFSIK